MSKIATDTATNELIHYVIAAWGYSVRWGSRLTPAEFTVVIHRHSSHARTEALAVVLEPAAGFVARD